MNKNALNLAQWLDKIAQIHPEGMALGLERVRAVFQKLGGRAPSCPVIIVGGTNGKGSTVATLEKIYLAAGYRVGVFTSPIIWRHNEMVRLQGKEAEDAAFCAAYEKIERARQEILLTSFEYHTLAALDIFQEQNLEVWLLEVGLGGRLDAVNILDADVSIVTSIALDHQQWLGESLEEIAAEKAGIFRAERPAIFGGLDLPLAIKNKAESLRAPLYQQGKDFYFGTGEKNWCWKGLKTSYADLPLPQLALENISSALMALELLQKLLPVGRKAIAEGIEKVSLPGRIERISSPRKQILDVAHNPAAVAFLAKRLGKIPHAVFSMLGDKDIAGSLREIKEKIERWYVAPLAVQRGATESELRAAFAKEEIRAVEFFPSIEEAHAAALRASSPLEEVLVFGSFHVVGKLVSK